MQNLRAVMALVALAVLGLVVGCATNPVTGKHQLSLVSSSQELAIGQEGYGAVLAEYGQYDDKQLAAFVDSVGKKLAAVSHLPKLEWHFTLLDDPTVNAFAMPGGYIYITRGIMAHLNSEAQLAGVLGHEIGHVTARHTANRMTQQQLAGLGVGIASVISPTFQRYSGMAQQALGLMFLKYSRDDETQADQLGVEYATKAGYDPREIPETYVMLRRVGEAGGQRMPAFMSTHPDPGDREVRTHDLAAAAAAGKTGLIIHNRDYVRRLDGMVFGNDPRQGWFEGTKFTQPELGFEITFPTGWQTQNTRAAVMAANKDQSGVMQMTIADAKNMTPEQYVAAVAQGQRIASPQGQSETIGGYSAWVGRAGLVQQDGSVAPITIGLLRKTADTPMFQILGQSASGDDRDIVASIRSFRPSTAKRAPERVKVVTVPKTEPFSAAATAFGPLAIDIAPLSIMNIVEPDEPVAQGTLIKIVPKP